MNKKLSIWMALFAAILAMLACGTAAGVGVSNVRMANDSDGKNVSKTFAPSDSIYVFFDVNQVGDGAVFKIKSYALNVGGPGPGAPFTTTDYSYNGESTIYTQIENTTGGFPAGQYKVEIDLNDVKAGETQFTVQ